MTDMKRFLHGPFAPVTEEITAFDLPVTGQVPAGLNGRYLRNGPNPLGLDDPELPLVPGRRHGARGAAARRPRRVVPQPLGPLPGRRARHSARRGRAARSTTGWTSPPTPTSSPTPGAPWPPSKPARCPTSSSDELDTVGPCDFGGTLPGGFAAHTKVDPRDRRAARHRLLLGLGPRPARRRRRRRQGEPHDRHPGHRRPDDARLRAHRAATWCCFDLPVTFSMDAVSGREEAAVHVEPRPPGPGRPAAPRRQPPADVRWFEVDPCWVFHTLNAYDDGGRVVVDLCRYHGRLRRLHSRDGHGPLTLDRWIIDPAAGKVTEQTARRPRAGVPPRRRPGHLPAAPLRLQRGDRRGRPGRRRR